MIGMLDERLYERIHQKDSDDYQQDDHVLDGKWPGF